MYHSGRHPDGTGTTVAEVHHTIWPDGKGKGKGTAAVTAAWPQVVEYHNWPEAGQTKGGHAMTSAKGMHMKAEDRYADSWESNWGTACQQDTHPGTDPAEDEWLKKLNDVLGLHEPEKKVTMADFNRSLEEVVTSHQDVNYADCAVSRFSAQEKQPATSWKARCFCPMDPACREEDAGKRIRNEIGTMGVDWAYHLAAVLRLMPSGQARKA